MKIAIIVAMTKELDLLLPMIEGNEEVSRDGIVFHTGRLSGKDVAVMQCGIGKVNAAVGAYALIETFNPDLVINSGVAGGTGSDAGILDVVVGAKVAYHDVWCGPCSDRGRVQGLPQYFEPTAEILRLAGGVEGVKAGLIASGDQFVDNAVDLARIKDLYPDVLAVDMESAAIAHVCYLRNVPFLSVRVISDTPGEVDNTAQYAHFWEDAPKQTFRVLVDFLSIL